MKHCNVLVVIRKKLKFRNFHDVSHLYFVFYSGLVKRDAKI